METHCTSMDVWKAGIKVSRCSSFLTSFNTQLLGVLLKDEKALNMSAAAEPFPKKKRC